MPTASEARIVNSAFLDALTTPGMEKVALDGAHDFIRLKIRDEGAWRRITNPIQVQNSDLNRLVHTAKPAIIVDVEPDSPAAMSLPFGGLPLNFYIRGPRFLVPFAEIQGPRFVGNINEMRTWEMDIRQVLLDNSLKDVMAKEDETLVSAINTALVGPDVVLPYANIAQWFTLSGGLRRVTLTTTFQQMPKFHSRAEIHTILTNNVTYREFQKWDRVEMGGDLSQDMITKGIREFEFMDARWVVTVKRDLVPDNTLFLFADMKLIGKAYILDDITLYMDRKANMFEFYPYETVGGGFAHLGGLGRVDYV